jgi:hypothetical protein
MGFQTVGTVMFGAPLETKKHINNTIKFVNSLPLDTAIFTVLKYHMGSPLWNAAVEEGKIRNDEFLIPADSHRSLCKFSSKELFNVSKRAYLLFYLRPLYIIDQLVQAIKRREITHFIGLFRFLRSIN